MDIKPSIKEEEEWKPQQPNFVLPFKREKTYVKKQQPFSRKNHPTCLYEFCRRVSSQTFLCSSKTIPGLLICNACKSYEDQNDKLIPRNARRRLGRGGRNHSNKTQCDRCQQKSTKTRKNKNGEIKYVYIASPLNPDISLCSHCYRSESRQLRRARKRREKQLNVKEEDHGLLQVKFYQPPELRRKKTKRKQRRKVTVGDFVESDKDGTQGTVLEVGKTNITILSTASVVHEIPKGKIKLVRSADKLPEISVKAEDDDLYIPPSLPKSWQTPNYFVQEQARNPFPMPSFRGNIGSLPPSITIPTQETDEVKAGDWLETNGFEGIVLEVETDVISLLVGNDVLKVRRFTSPVPDRAVSPDAGWRHGRKLDDLKSLPPMFDVQMDSNFVNVTEPVFSSQLPNPSDTTSLSAFHNITEEPFKSLATRDFSQTELKKLEAHYFTEKINIVIDRQRVDRRYQCWTKAVQERITRFKDENLRLIALRFMYQIEHYPTGSITLPYQLLHDECPGKEVQIQRKDLLIQSS